MDKCSKFNPDKVFKQFSVIVFPTTFVGLASVLEQNIEYDLECSVYIKTRCNGQLMKFSEARDVSPDHRSFEITRTDSHTLLIKFNPTNECIARAKRNNLIDNRFMIDLRILSACGLVPCCSNENHCEVARYYIFAQYAFPKLKCIPNILDFGNIYMKTPANRTVEISNESSTLAVKVQYCKEVGFRVHPSKCLIKPKTSIMFVVLASPTTTLKTLHALYFKVMHPHDSFEKRHSEVISSKRFDNALKLPIAIKFNTIYEKKVSLCPIESLHKLSYVNFQLTFNERELNLMNKNKEKSKSFIRFARKSEKKNNNSRKVNKTYDSFVTTEYKNNAEYKKYSQNICDVAHYFVLTPEFIGVDFSPLEVDFKNVVVYTETQEKIYIENKTQMEIHLLLASISDNIRFSNKKLAFLNIKLPAKSHKIIILTFTNNVIGSVCGHFEYIINNIFKMQHPFRAEVQNPELCVNEHHIKFGMVTSECFITSAPVCLINKYNIDLYFEWETIKPDTPFKVIPQNGFVSSKSFQMCSIVSTRTVTKIKHHTLTLMSCGKSIEIEMITYTRKVVVKFLESKLLLCKIPLNLETIKTVLLENYSKEVAHFYVLEPPMPGLIVSPMHGNIRPKSLLPFKIIINISCVIEFTADILLKINNKEVIILSIIGSTLEPRIVIQPKLLNLPRIPYGMIMYVPIVIQNIGSLRSIIQTINERITDDKCLNYDFEIFSLQGIEMKILRELTLESGQVSTVYVKLDDTERRSYDTYLPITINNLLGPPDSNISGSNDLQHFVQEFEKLYVNCPKVEIRSMHGEICCCRATGVFCNKCLIFSHDCFSLDYEYGAKNEIIFSIINASKITIPITILTTKLRPNFTLEALSENITCKTSDTLIYFDLDHDVEVKLAIYFHPIKMGKYESVADLFIDKAMSIAYHNLKFIGTYETLMITPSIDCLYFSPCMLGSTLSKTFILLSKINASKMLYKLDPPNQFLNIVFSERNAVKHSVAVKIKITCDRPESQRSNLIIYTSEGSECKLPLSFCFTACPLTLHSSYVIKQECNPYPFYPMDETSDYAMYMNTSVFFLEKWMYQQGFRRELFPVIPDTFHATSKFLVGPSAGSNNISIVNFIRRIAGPLTKHLNKVGNFISNSKNDSKEKNLLKVHEVYEEIIDLVKKHGGLLGMMQAKYLLNFEEFVVYSKLGKCEQDEADYLFDEELINSKDRFKRLNKQIWFDLILQCYKVFVFDCCLFDSLLEHNIDDNNDVSVEKILGWYNALIEKEYDSMFSELSLNPGESNNCPENHKISNFTSDLSDGIAFAAATVYFCPFMKEDLLGLCKVHNKDENTKLIHNSLLVIKCWNKIKLHFPIECEDFLVPNYLQMLFLMVHLNVILPMLKPREVLEFHPPLLGSSSRNVTINTGFQESVLCMHTFFNNDKNTFVAEKDSGTENDKKTRINIKYTAKFTSTQTSILLLQCHNKTRIFDTCVTFVLKGYIGSMEPITKYKINCPLYKPMKMDIMVSSPFSVNCTYRMILTEEEPKVPAKLERTQLPQFLVRRVNLLDDEVTLAGTTHEATAEPIEHRLVFLVVCTSTEPSNAWIWFSGEAGEFYVRITILPRTDSPQDTLQAKIGSWPIETCSCGDECECYRTAVLAVPHRNYHTLHSLRNALQNNASQTMMDVFDEHIETSTGRLLVSKLLEEHGTNMREVAHILKDESRYTVTSKCLLVSLRSVSLQQHTDGELPLRVTVPLTAEISDKFSITLTSECGLDVRTYRVNFFKDESIWV